MDIVVFGAGVNGVKFFQTLAKSQRDFAYSHIQPLEDIRRIRCFVDNNPAVQGGHLGPHPILPPDTLKDMEYDELVVSVGSIGPLTAVLDQLDDLGVPRDKIQILAFSETAYDEALDPRVAWTRVFAQYAALRGLKGSAAECGVYFGAFAERINQYFPDRTLYLFDTFEGFPEGDLEHERALANPAFEGGMFTQPGHFLDTHPKLVLRRMPHPEQCRLRPGTFPETAAGLEDEFCFVNLDMDLFKPTLAALEWFWDKMVPGGVILMHDYFAAHTPGIAAAITAFEEKIGGPLPKLPIGDPLSIAVVKA